MSEIGEARSVLYVLKILSRSNGSNQRRHITFNEVLADFNRPLHLNCKTLLQKCIHKRNILHLVYL